MLYPFPQVKCTDRVLNSRENKDVHALYLSIYEIKNGNLGLRSPETLKSYLEVKQLIYTEKNQHTRSKTSAKTKGRRGSCFSTSVKGNKYLKISYAFAKSSKTRAE